MEKIIKKILSTIGIESEKNYDEILHDKNFVQGFFLGAILILSASLLESFITIYMVKHNFQI